jgi:hypothetical protein
VATAPVALEDGHVEGGGADVEGENDGGYGDVDFGGWREAEADVFGRVRGALAEGFMLVILMMMMMILWCLMVAFCYCC